MSDENIKMNENDLEKVESIQEEFDKLTYQLGKTQLNIMQAKERLEEHKDEKTKIEEKMDDLRKKYRKVSKELHKKYGSGLFDSETGELIKREEVN